MQERRSTASPCPVRTSVAACQECSRSKRKGREWTKEGPSSGHHRQQTPRASPHLKVIHQHNLKPPHHFPAALPLSCPPLCRPLVNTVGCRAGSVPPPRPPTPPRLPRPPPPTATFARGSGQRPETLGERPAPDGREAKRIPKSASAPSAHLFDSSQLKLRKTAEGLQRRRGKLTQFIC